MIHAFCSIYMYISKSVRDGERPINATFVGANDRKQRNKQKLYKKEILYKKMYKKEMLLIIQKRNICGCVVDLMEELFSFWFSCFYKYYKMLKKLGA